MKKMQVAVLGATGIIGQRFVQLLEDHPWFEIQGLYASERSEGKRLGEVNKVKDHVFMPQTLDRKVVQIDPAKIAKTCRIAFSGLPSEIAKDYESQAGGGRGCGILQRRLAPDARRRAAAHPRSQRQASGPDQEAVHASPRAASSSPTPTARRPA